MVRVSVIVPTFNRERYIRHALSCVFEQKFDDLEVIVVDDGSTDKTESVVRGLGRTVRYVALPKRRGPAHARNVGIGRARGEYIAFLDSDDVWLPGKLRAQVEALDARQDVALCFTDFYFERERVEGQWEPPKIIHSRTEEPVFADLFWNNFIGTSTVLVRRTLFGRVGPFRESLARGSDYDMWLRVIADWRVRRVPQVLSRYRRHESSITGLDIETDARTWFEITRELVRRQPGVLDALGVTQADHRRALYDCLAEAHDQDGNVDRARAYRSLAARSTSRGDHASAGVLSRIQSPAACRRRRPRLSSSDK